MEKSISGHLSKPGSADDAAEHAPVPTPFASMLTLNGLELVRGHTGVLQVNTGLHCNQMCRHCHLEAGPGRDDHMLVGD